MILRPAASPTEATPPQISEVARAVLADPRAKLLPAPARELVQAMADQITAQSREIANLNMHVRAFNSRN